jgi:hypothetical protein
MINSGEEMTCTWEGRAKWTVDLIINPISLLLAAYLNKV